MHHRRAEIRLLRLRIAIPPQILSERSPTELSGSRTWRFLSTHLSSCWEKMVLIDESWQSALLFKYLLRENQQVGMRTFSLLVGRLWIWNDLLSISFFYSDAGKKVSRSQQQQVAVKLKTCPGCGRSFRWNFSRHRSECHALAAKRRFSCPTCPSTFTRNATLRYHLEHVHGLPFHRWRAGPAILQRGGIYPRRTEMCVSEGFTRLNDRPRSSSLSYAASLSRDPIFPPQTFFFFFLSF